MISKKNPSDKIQDTRIKGYSNTTPPEKLWKILPRSLAVQEIVIKTRKAIEDIIRGKDKRKIFIIGPCSVHSLKETKEYSEPLADISREISDKILLIERINVEKPRTLADWPGILEDPDRDGSNDIEKGRRLARQLLLELNEMDIPCAVEYVNTSTPQYIGDLISWCWVGARTVESQMHKRMASGLSTSVGFKNNSQGNIDSAINAILTASVPSKFPGIRPDGKEAIISTAGNPYGVIILRGGEKPNYSAEDIKAVQKKLKLRRLRPNIIIDCSHGNSGKDYKKQPQVFKNIIKQMNSNRNIIGLMLESYINEGQQRIIPGKKLKKDISITDSCISLPKTLELIQFAYKNLKVGSDPQFPLLYILLNILTICTKVLYCCYDSQIT